MSDRHAPGARVATDLATFRTGPSVAEAPVVVDSPHSGRTYPDDFRPAVETDILRKVEDRFVDALFCDAPDHGATLLAARFARSYIDPNRGSEEIDPDMIAGRWPDPTVRNDHTRHGLGLIFREIGGTPIYDRLLTVEEARHRIQRYWSPYHDALDASLTAHRTRHGAVWHLNCHSMLPVGDELSPDPGEERPDFSLGDLDGRSCDGAFTGFVAGALKRMGYSVGVNHPYRGALIVDRHGRPAEGRHSLQIEVNRALYMDTRDLRLHDGFQVLRRDIGRLLAMVCDHARAQAERAGAP